MPIYSSQFIYNQPSPTILSKNLFVFFPKNISGITELKLFIKILSDKFLPQASLSYMKRSYLSALAIKHISLPQEYRKLMTQVGHDSGPVKCHTNLHKKMP